MNLHRGAKNGKANRRFLIRAGCFFVLALIALCPIASAQSTAINYTITLKAPARHLLQIEINVPSGSAQRELQLPVWNALYQVRNFSQYVNWVRAKDVSGKSLEVHEINDSRWMIEGASSGATVDYEIYADTSGPFGTQFNTHHAFLNLAEVLMYPVESRNSPMHVRFEQIPTGWRVATPLSSTDDVTAPNYDRLVDSPVEIGQFQESDFDESGAHFRVIVDADASDYEMPGIVSALHKIVASAISWMNDRPFDSYMFVYHFPRGPAGGGMEHAYSTAIDLSANVMDPGLAAFSSVTAHEFFHLWNVKRIRPQSLEPIDYTKENFTRALWFSEGMTSTAEGVILSRAGLVKENRYLAGLADSIAEIERAPAHRTQSVEESSLDAWLEGNNYYRRPERSISYYTKGELLGVMLDLALRDASHGSASLRELFQWMNDHYAKQGRFFDDSSGVRQAAEAVTHSDLGWFFTKYVSGTDEIPWNDFLGFVGLRLVQTPKAVPDTGFQGTSNFDGSMVISELTAGGEAERAGLQVGDSVITLQGKTTEFADELSRLQAGDNITMKVRSHRGAPEHELKWKVGSRQDITYEIKDLDKVTPEQRAHRAAWLKGEAEAAPPHP